MILTSTKRLSHKILLACMTLILFSCQNKMFIGAAVTTSPQHTVLSAIGSSIVDFNADENTLFLKTVSAPVSNNTAIDNIYVADTSNQEYCNYNINGVPGVINTANQSSTVLHLPDVMYQHAVYIEATGGTGDALYFRFSDQNISAGSTQELYHVMNGITSLPRMPGTPAPVHITEYGDVGQFVAGNFTVTVHNFNTAPASYVISCEFRVRRQF